MFYQIVLYIHIMVCLLLMVIVLIQSGRGGGLSEGFSGAESIFGTKTNAFLTRATSVLAVMFFITCLSLAVLSKQRTKSLLEGRPQPDAAEPKTVTEEKSATKPILPETKPVSQLPEPKTKEGALESKPSADSSQHR